jgi:hypothetical protein
MAEKTQGLASPMTFHPVAVIFPLMDGEDYDKLVANIKEHGQQVPIILHEGMILDGRNRERACRQLGIESQYQQYDGNQDPGDYVWSVNAQRRHLTVGQRALAAAKLTMLRRGSNQHAAKVDGSPEPSKNLTQYQAALLAGISCATLKRVKYIQEHGTADDVAAVERGEDIKPIHNRVGLHVVQTARKPKRRRGPAKPPFKPSDVPARFSDKVTQLKDDADDIVNTPTPELGADELRASIDVFADILAKVGAKQEEFKERLAEATPKVVPGDAPQEPIGQGGNAHAPR